MTESGATPRRRGMSKYLLIVLAGGLVLLGALAWFSTTSSFQSWVRNRLIAELERVTGGRVELGSFHSIPFRFQVEVRDLTIHGKEAVGEVPYAHIDRLTAEVKLISVLGAEFGFHSVIMEHPVIHAIINADGTTNQPQPKVRSEKSAVEQLLSLSIGRLQVQNGEFLINDRKIPFDFDGNDVAATLSYSFLHRRYEGDLSIGKLDTHYQDFRPVAWTIKTHFLLGSTSLEVRHMLAETGRSSLDVSGRWDDFRKPAIDGSYKVVADVAEVAAILHQPEARRGSVQLSGSGKWSAADFSSSGKLSVKDLDWRNTQFAVKSVGVDMDFSIDPQKLTLSRIAAQLLGGDVSGQAEVVNWLSPPPSTKVASKKGDEQKGSINLRLKNISIGEIASALASTARPLDRLRLAGNADGTLESRWTGSPRNAETEIAADVRPPSRVPPGQLALNAHTRAVYRRANEELEIREFNASTPATQVRAQGILSSHAAMRVFVHTTNLAEWQPEFIALGYREPIPVTLQGAASFEGTATGKLSAIQFAGKLESQHFDFLIPATRHAPQKEVRWDSLVADIQLSPDGFAAHNGSLRHGDATVNFDLTTGLQEREFSGNSPISARLNVQNVQIAEILDIAGSNFPATGTANLFVQVSGTRNSPHAAGWIQANEAHVYNQFIPRFESKLELLGDDLSLTNIRMTYYDTPVTGGAKYNLATHTFHLSADGKGFDLTKFPQTQNGRLQVEGKLDVSAEGSGTLEAPALNAVLHFRDLTFDHELSGDYVLNAVTHGSDMHLTGRSQFKNAELSLDGDVRLHEDWLADVTLHFNHLDVDPLLRSYAKGQVTGHSATAGDLHLTGPIRRPRDLQLTGSLSDLFADVEHIQVRNNGAIRFNVTHDVLQVEQFRLVGQGTDLSLTGSVQLDGEHSLRLRAEGNASLQLIESFNPDFTTSGTVAVNVEAGGTIASPSLQGRLQLSGGSIAYADLPSSLSDLNGSLVFDQNRLQIETLTARVGGGTVSFGGYASAYNRVLNFDLTLAGRDVRLRYPPGVSSVTNADLRFAGTSSASTLTGDATITKLAVTPGFDFGGYLASSAQSAALPQTNPLLNRIRLDLHIVTLPELQMQTAALRLSGDADLHLRGTLAKPVLLGRADVIEGQIYFNGQKYRMERGEVTFTNPVTTTPVLDLQAATHVREYDITVNLNGEFDKLNLTYHSEPPLPSSDIISLLALGQTQEQSAQLQSSGQQNFTQQASSAALAEALNSALSSRARSLFGISHIKVDPQGLNTETSPTTSAPAVTIEQQVKDNLTITYSTNVSQTSQQIIQAEYNFTRNVSILGIRDYNGVISFELRVRQRRK
jgi:translocation and assembly module TamB